MSHWVGSHTNDPILKAKLNWTWKKSNSSDAKIFVCVFIFHFCT